jgi:hypothetical protein
MSAGTTSNAQGSTGTLGVDDPVTPSEVTVKAGGIGVRPLPLPAAVLAGKKAFCTAKKAGVDYLFYFKKADNPKWNRWLNYVLDAITDDENLAINLKAGGTDIGSYKEADSVKPA